MTVEQVKRFIKENIDNNMKWAKIRAMNACGMGMTPSGYYLCAMAGGIDRVFGFDIARKKMPLPGDPMLDQSTVICQYCGRFRGMGGWVKKEIISPSWQKALKEYKTKKPTLSSY